MQNGISVIWSVVCKPSQSETLTAEAGTYTGFVQVPASRFPQSIHQNPLWHQFTSGHEKPWEIRVCYKTRLFTLKELLTLQVLNGHEVTFMCVTMMSYWCVLLWCDIGVCSILMGVTFIIWCLFCVSPRMVDDAGTRRFLLLYGSQTGQAKAIAEEVAENATSQGLDANLKCFSLTEKKVKILMIT